MKDRSNKTRIPIDNLMMTSKIMKLMVLSYANIDSVLSIPSFDNRMYISRKENGDIYIIIIDQNKKDLYSIIQEPKDGIIIIRYYDSDDKGVSIKDRIETKTTYEYDCIFSKLRKFINSSK